MKVAIYVEGITEAGFVYQLIGEKYQWDWSLVTLMLKVKNILI